MSPTTVECAPSQTFPRNLSISYASPFCELSCKQFGPEIFAFFLFTLSFLHVDSALRFPMFISVGCPRTTSSCFSFFPACSWKAFGTLHLQFLIFFRTCPSIDLKITDVCGFESNYSKTSLSTTLFSNALHTTIFFSSASNFRFKICRWTFLLTF